MFQMFLVSDAVEAVNEVIQPSAIQKFIEELPDKALRLGVRVILALLFFFLGSLLIKAVRKILKKSLLKANVEVGVTQFIDSFTKTTLYVLLVLIIANKFGLDAASIVAVLGSAGLAFGLALQGSLSNLAGGVLILILKPFKVGDYIIDGSGHEGSVTQVHMFYTTLVTVDNKKVILPNGALANNTITNVSALPYRRLDLPVGISYNANLQLAKETLMHVIEKDEAVLDQMEKLVYVNDLGSSSVDLCVRFWVKKEDYWTAKFRMTENMKLALDEAGVQIPFPQLDVHFDKENKKSFPF